MSNNPNSVVWGGGGNKPLTNSLNTKNSTPQKLTKNPKKIPKPLAKLVFLSSLVCYCLKT
ncbi:hypothetical protein [Helicobacter pullorum]|uniref:hypothetical protein n=1 Tax=Helicobacter pullorum TaxID=35818 RepID=UPI0006CCF1E0|nr:hypothetical protein [Helicobacter pullorum]KPH51806.1 hypothetical protein HPU229254_05530 [Helicobacter pullorum]